MSAAGGFAESGRAGAGQMAATAMQLAPVGGMHLLLTLALNAVGSIPRGQT
jgi:hypothetical protein